MLVYRIVNARYASEQDALSGMGAFRAGGRFNPVGTFAVYTARTLELAILEYTFATPNPLRERVHLLKIAVPDNLILTLDRNLLPADWRIRVYDNHPVQQALRNWFRHNESLAIQVPSSIAVESMNIIINPLHPDFRENVKSIYNELYTYDGADPLRTV